MEVMYSSPYRYFIKPFLIVIYIKPDKLRRLISYLSITSFIFNTSAVLKKNDNRMFSTKGGMATGALTPLDFLWYCQWSRIWTLYTPVHCTLSVSLYVFLDFKLFTWSFISFILLLPLSRSVNRYYTINRILPCD